MKVLMCPYCGAREKITHKNGMYHCSYCLSDFYDEAASKESAILERMSKKEQDDIARARRNLYDATHKKSFFGKTIINDEKIRTYARQLKKLRDDDFQANFYETFVEIHSGESHEEEFNMFLDGIDVKANERNLNDVLSYSIIAMKEDNVLAVKALIERAYDPKVGALKDSPDSSEKYTTYMNEVEVEAQKLKDSIYEPSLTRDVFVAYSSKDTKTVRKVVSYIEGEGYSCYVALRNMRQARGSKGDYRAEIRKALNNCKIFLFISSKNSRNIYCDAIREELFYVRENRKGMGKILYILDGEGNITKELQRTLNEFFEGCQRVTTGNEEDIKERIEEILLGKSAEAVRIPAQERPKNEAVKYCTNCGKKVPFNANFCMECGGKAFAEDYIKYLQEKLQKQIDDLQAQLDQQKTKKETKVEKAKDTKTAEENCQRGEDYYFGQNGVAQDYFEAVKWFKKAAEQGHARAQCSLGRCYYYGQGVAQDYFEAVKWVKKAAEQGDARAQHNLGVCYYYGQGVAQDYSEAVKWYKKAAEQGHARAQNNLGVCYENGQGVELNKGKAKYWWQLAAKQGNENAKNNLKGMFFIIAIEDR